MTPKQEKHQQAVLATAHHDYSKKLNAYAFFKVRNSAISEELVQSTFTKTWSYLIKGGTINRMKAFLYHILNDLIIDEYRKRKTTSLDVLRAKGFEPSTDDSQRLFNFLDGQSALLLFARLTKRYQRVMSLKYVQNLSLKEISQITGQSINNIAVQAHRGLEKLKLLYNPA
ncbi:MAG: RNA polymerase sigma factor [Patescibacteria group bacterium]